MHILVEDLLWAFRLSNFIYGFVFQESVKKHCVAKVFVVMWEIFLHEYNWNYNSYKFSYKCVETKNKNQIFSELLLWKQKNCLLLFKASPALLQRHANLINFYEGIFLHFILVRSLVQRCSTFPCFLVQVKFTCSKSTIETLEKGAKYVQSQQEKHLSNVNDVLKIVFQGNTF